MATKFLNGIDATSQKIINLASPTASTDAVNKAYVDNVAAGLDAKQSVRAATTANITLSGTQTIDGVAVIAADRVLVKNQTTASQNGIYVAAAGAWALAADSANTLLTSGALVTVEEGTTNGSKSYVLTTANPITVGTTAQVWSPFSVGGTTYTAGNGLQLVSTAFSILLDSSPGLLSSGTGLKIDPAYSGLAKRYAVNVPSGSTSATITHSLGTLDVVVEVYDIASGASVQPDVTLTSTSVVTLTFAVAPTTNQYRCVVIG